MSTTTGSGKKSKVKAAVEADAKKVEQDVKAVGADIKKDVAKLKRKK